MYAVPANAQSLSPTCGRRPHEHDSGASLSEQGTPFRLNLQCRHFGSAKKDVELPFSVTFIIIGAFHKHGLHGCLANKADGILHPAVSNTTIWIVSLSNPEKHGLIRDIAASVGLPERLLGLDDALR
ncbi:hypothetical protein E4U55_004867 [Claviceps digitariae]|nr:hypothetical protein E4U55_004867 [Claviceps digitariae]